MTTPSDEPPLGARQQPAPHTTTQLRLQRYRHEYLEAEWRFAQPFTIGSDPACDVCLRDPYVNPTHSQLYTDGTVWWVRDVGGRIDTFVNGAQTDLARLGSPSVLQIGLYGPVLDVTIEPIDRSTAHGLITAPPSEEAPNASSTLTPAVVREEPQQHDSISPPTGRYQGHGFSLPFPDAWQDYTLFTLAGPSEGGIRHTITISVDWAVKTDALETYVDEQLGLLAIELYDFMLLKRDTLTLHDGHPASRAIYRWDPLELPTLYQEQLIVLGDGTAYRLTATFTRNTRKTLGPQIEQYMLGFTLAT